MARGRKIQKKDRIPDSVYKSKMVAKMINMIMLDGKKYLAQNILYKTLDKLSTDKKDARQMLEDAVKNVMPNVEIRTRRIGGTNYSIPVPLKHDRAETLAIRWIIKAARSKKGASMVVKLQKELTDAYAKDGNAMKKKIETHKMAEANKAFAHFKW